MTLILQKYIFREIGKTFVLSALALTAVLSTCGGVYNLTTLDNLTAYQTLLLIAFIVPTCAAFTLPIAALFSATITYGRMASDNEFVACRASGIGTLSLFVPCLVLSVMSAVVTFVLFNFVIPGFSNQINLISRAGIKTMVEEGLRGGQSREFNNQRVYAREITSVPPQNLGGGADEAIVLSGVAFLQFEEGDVVRIGTAESAAVKFRTRGAFPEIEADLSGIRGIDLKGHVVWDPGAKRIGPVEVPLPQGLRPRYMSLPKLLQYRKRPEDIIPKLQRLLQQTSQVVMCKLLLDYCQQAFLEGRPVQMLSDEGLPLTVRAAEPKLVFIPAQRSVSLELADLTVEQQTRLKRDQFRAQRGEIEINLEPDGRARIALKLAGTVEYQGSDGIFVPIDDRVFDGLQLPAEVQQQLDSPQYSPEALYAGGGCAGLGTEVEQLCNNLSEEHSKYVSRMYSEIHLRIVYSASVVLLAVLGAALGVIWRGGQLLVAFGISFVPTFVLILVTIIGKDVAKSEDTILVGLSIMWGGLAAVAALDLVVLRRYLPR